MFPASIECKKGSVVSCRVFDPLTRLFYTGAGWGVEGLATETLLTKTVLTNIYEDSYTGLVNFPAGGPFEIQYIDPATKKIYGKDSTIFAVGTETVPVLVVPQPGSSALQTLYGFVENGAGVVLANRELFFDMQSPKNTATKVHINTKVSVKTDVSGMFTVQVKRGATYKITCSGALFNGSVITITNDATKDLATYAL